MDVPYSYTHTLTNNTLAGMYAKLSMLSVRTEPGLCQSCGQVRT